MNKRMRMILRNTGLICLLLVSGIAGAQIHNITLTVPKPNPLPPPVMADYNFDIGTSIGAGTAGVHVVTATATVQWNFTSVPGGAVVGANNFVFQGVTVTLPAAEGVSVSSASNVTITGTPSAGATSFSFSVQVNEAADVTNTAVGTYTVLMHQPTDVVLVLDRSGSMSINTSAGVSRWNALRSAATNFLTFYQALARPSDRLSITYFESDLLPSSGCCNTLIPVVAPIATTVNTEIGTNTPGGSTGMGSGLKNAQTKLSDATKARSILLLTDGEQNIPLPSVNLNGQGYSDATTIPGGPAPGGIKIATIGIGSPGGAFHTTLSNLASNNRGSYYTSEDGTAFDFKGGNNVGDLSGGFTSAFVTMLSAFSPQIIDNTASAVPANNTPVTLQSFPLNKQVDKLLLQFSVDKNFEVPQLVQLFARIMVQKDGVSVMKYAKPSWAGNYTNTIMLTFDFKNPPSGQPPLNPSGKWTVQISDSTLRYNFCKLTSVADDHRLHIQRTFGNKTPKVNDAFPITVKLDWLNHAIKDGKVEALILRPGEDLGDLLARNTTRVKLDEGPDAGSPGLQKYTQLWATDSAFRKALERSENLVTLSHTQDGKYEGTFNGLTVSGVYRVVFRISGNGTETGEYQRYMSESFYVSFSGIDMSKSQVTTSIANGQLVMTFRPITSYGRYIGPAMGDAFTVSNPKIKISKVTDNQDGSYTITFTGSISDTTTLEVLGQKVYTGKLENAGKGGGSIIDRAKEWLKSMGLPGWSLWAILALLLLIILMLLRRKK